MKDSRFVVLPSVMTADGTLALSGHTTNCDSVIDALDTPDDIAVTMSFVGDLGEGQQLDESGYPAIVFHFTPGETTVGAFEAEVDESQHLAVQTPGTAAHVLEDNVDEFSNVTVATGTIAASTNQAQIDLTGANYTSLFLDQLNDAGTVTLLVEKTVDGVNWATVATKHETDFPAGTNKSIEISLSDANGMPLVAKAARVTATALAGGGVYGFHAGVRLLDGYR